MRFRAFRPDNPEQITPMLNPVSRFPYIGPAFWETIGQEDTFYINGYLAPRFYSLGQRVQGSVRKLPSGSVHSMTVLTDLDVTFAKVTIKGIQREFSATHAGSKWVQLESIPKDYRPVLAGAIFSYLNEDIFEDDITEQHATEFSDKVRKTREIDLRLADEVLSSLVKKVQKGHP